MLNSIITLSWPASAFDTRRVAGMRPGLTLMDVKQSAALDVVVGTAPEVVNLFSPLTPGAVGGVVAEMVYNVYHYY